MANGSYCANELVDKSINFGQIIKNKYLKAKETDLTQAETERGRAYI